MNNNQQKAHKTLESIERALDSDIRYFSTADDDSVVLSYDTSMHQRPDGSRTYTITIEAELLSDKAVQFEREVRATGLRRPSDRIFVGRNGRR